MGGLLALFFTGYSLSFMAGIGFVALIGLIADWRVTLDPEIFFLLFLPPLLFLDGWRIPREELFKDGRTVLGLSAVSTNGTDLRL